MNTMKLKVSKCAISREIWSFHRIEFQLAYYAGVPVLKPTEACSMFGGMCVHEDDCSESTSQKGTCAERGTNLECCYIGMDKLDRSFNRYQF